MLQDKFQTEEMARNRTGITTHPELSQELIAAVQNAQPSSQGSSEGLGVERGPWEREGARIGSLPERRDKLSQKGAQTQAELALLLDKMGERLQFERSGVRLYEALIAKRKQHSVAGSRKPNGAALPPLDELQQILNDELVHFMLLQQMIFELGGDPTVVTPSADIVTILGQGPTKVVTDPRTDITQALQAILAVELQDNDGWRLLIELAQTTGHNDLVPAMECALLDEETHLKLVRKWVTLLTTAKKSV